MRGIFCEELEQEYCQYNGPVTLPLVYNRCYKSEFSSCLNFSCRSIIAKKQRRYEQCTENLSFTEPAGATFG